MIWLLCPLRLVNLSGWKSCTFRAIDWLFYPQKWVRTCRVVCLDHVIYVTFIFIWWFQVTWILWAQNRYSKERTILGCLQLLISSKWVFHTCLNTSDLTPTSSKLLFSRPSSTLLICCWCPGSIMIYFLLFSACMGVIWQLMPLPLPRQWTNPRSRVGSVENWNAELNPRCNVPLLPSASISQNL